jgi:hypothetical protein
VEVPRRKEGPPREKESASVKGRSTEITRIPSKTVSGPSKRGRTTIKSGGSFKEERPTKKKRTTAENEKFTKISSTSKTVRCPSNTEGPTKSDRSSSRRRRTTKKSISI